MAHRKVDVVVDGLYGDWAGAGPIRDKIITLDVPFGTVFGTNCLALLVSLYAMECSRLKIFGDVTKDGQNCHMCCFGPTLFGLTSVLIVISLAVTIVYSYGLIAMYFVLRVLELLCGLPSGLYPMIDDIIDQVDHPITAGLDLVKYCPEHSTVDRDALELFLASVALIIAQAGMLACIHSSTESMNLSMFDIQSWFENESSNPRGVSTDSDDDDADSIGNSPKLSARALVATRDASR